MATTTERARGARADAARARESARQHARDAEQLRRAARREHRAAITNLWRARQLLYDRNGPMVAMWGDHGSRTEAIDSLIRQVFDVGLILASCRALAAEPVAAQLIDATHRLDDVIRALREMAFDGLWPAVDRGDEPPGAGEPGEVLERLGNVADALHVLAEEHAADGARAMQLGDAAHSVRRAWVMVRDDLG